MKRLFPILMAVLIIDPGVCFASELKVLTFNTWGIKGARDIKQRMELIPAAVSELSPDIMVFQEAFEEWERAILKAGLVKAGYPENGFRYYHLRSYGTGIFVVSRYPIIEERLEPYQAFQWPENKEQLGRGMASLRIKTPDLELLFFTTHITPGNLADVSRSEGMLEFYELAKFIYQEAGRTGLKSIIAAGDLNADPAKLIYQIFPALTGAENAFDVVHPGQFVPTNDRTADPYTIVGVERIDHILFANLAPASSGLIPIKAEVVFNHPYQDSAGKKYFLSDHFGVFAVFEISDQAKKISGAPVLLGPGLTSQEKARLKDHPDKSGGLSENKELWQKLGLAVLESQDQSKKRDAGLIAAAEKLLVEMAAPGKFRPDKKDLKALRRWLDR